MIRGKWKWLLILLAAATLWRLARQRRIGRKN